IRTYIQACNDADVEAIASCFCPGAVHYRGPADPKWEGPTTIGSNFAKRVRELGHYWTVDQLLIDVDRWAAALEGRGFDRQARFVRGVDWFVFEPQTFCVQEVRPYTAAPVHPDMARQEFLDFDYAGRGYPTTLPSKHTRGES